MLSLQGVLLFEENSKETLFTRCHMHKSTYIKNLCRFFCIEYNY